MEGSIERGNAARLIQPIPKKEKLKLKIAVIGCGYWGSKHVRVLSSMGDVDQVAIVEPSPRIRAKILKAFPSTRAYAELGPALLEVDAVVIATPPQTHSEIALMALRNSKHVLVEKPLARSVAEARLLVSEARRNNKVLMVGHTFLFNPAVKELRRRLATGELGEVQYIYSARLNLGLHRSDVNVVWDLAPHDITIMNFLLQSLPTSVSAWGSSLARAGVEDVAYLRLDYGARGVSGYIHLSWLDPRKVRTVTVVGTEKMAVYDDLADDRLRIYDRGVERLDGESPSYERPFTYRYGDVLSPHIRSGEPLTLEDQHFVDCIRDGMVPEEDRNFLECIRDVTVPETPGLNGIFVIAVLESLDQALQRRGPVNVDYSLDFLDTEAAANDVLIAR
jgi:predicted dehydrogenase